MSTEDRVKASFEDDVAEHELTVLHHDGLYRHLRFKKPGAVEYYVDVITWPGCMTVHGDMGTFTFSRVEDMLTFFTGRGSIDLRYWQEKLQGLDRSATRVWDPEKFKENVLAEYMDFVEEDPTAEYLLDLRDAIDDDVLSAADNEHEAISAACDFEDSPSGFSFADAWEWACYDFDYHFVWTCYALRRIANLWAAREQQATTAA